MTNQEFIDFIRMEGEEFKPVIGYEDLYMISSYARVVALSKYVNNRFQDVVKTCKNHIEVSNLCIYPITKLLPTCQRTLYLPKMISIHTEDLHHNLQQIHQQLHHRRLKQKSQGYTLSSWGILRVLFLEAHI